MTVEAKLREAATAFHRAWVEARAAGYTAVWPANPDGLEGLAVSQTATVDIVEIKPGEELQGVPVAAIPVLMPTEPSYVEPDANPFRRRKSQFPAD